MSKTTLMYEKLQIKNRELVAAIFFPEYTYNSKYNTFEPKSTLKCSRASSTDNSIEGINAHKK